MHQHILSALGGAAALVALYALWRVGAEIVRRCRAKRATEAARAYSALETAHAERDALLREVQLLTRRCRLLTNELRCDDMSQTQCMPSSRPGRFFNGGQT